MSKTNPARGMRDFLPSDVRKREYVIGIIKEVYESYGYEPLETPAVENIETLMGKYGDEGNQLIFKILKRGQKLADELQRNSEAPITAAASVNSLSDLALRYDLTVPLARVVADRRNELPKFFKRYQIQPVWRADRPARGRFREFYQCDVDAIGSRSNLIEVEQISAVIDILKQLGFQDFKVRLNHRELLMALMVRQVAEDKIPGAITILDKADKIGIEGVRAELENQGNEPAKIAVLLKAFKEMDAYYEREKSDYQSEAEANVEWNRVSFETFSTRFDESSEGERANLWLKEICDLLGPYQGFVKRDMTLARGLSYYTGTIMEINVPDLAGSLGGGGRYDGLIGMFGKEQIPACGFSLGLERILVVMDERGMFPPGIAESTPADVMVTIWNEEAVADTLKLASELRSHGLRVTLYPEADKLGKQLKYADSIRVPFVCILGPEEVEKGVAKLKNMRTGEEVTEKPAKFAEIIRKRK